MRNTRQPKWQGAEEKPTCQIQASPQTAGQEQEASPIQRKATVKQPASSRLGKTIRSRRAGRKSKQEMTVAPHKDQGCSSSGREEVATLGPAREITALIQGIPRVQRERRPVLSRQVLQNQRSCLTQFLMSTNQRETCVLAERLKRKLHRQDGP